MGGSGVRITHREMGSWMSTYHSYTQQTLKIDVVISSLTAQVRKLEKLAQR